MTAPTIMISPLAFLLLLLLLPHHRGTASGFYVRGKVGDTDVDLEFGLGDSDGLGGLAEGAGLASSLLGMLPSSSSSHSRHRRVKRQEAQDGIAPLSLQPGNTGFEIFKEALIRIWEYTGFVVINLVYPSEGGNIRTLLGIDPIPADQAGGGAAMSTETDLRHLLYYH